MVVAWGGWSLRKPSGSLSAGQCILANNAMWGHSGSDRRPSPAESNAVWLERDGALPWPSGGPAPAPSTGIEIPQHPYPHTPLSRLPLFVIHLARLCNRPGQPDATATLGFSYLLAANLHRRTFNSLAILWFPGIFSESFVSRTRWVRSQSAFFAQFFVGVNTGRRKEASPVGACRLLARNSA